MKIILADQKQEWTHLDTLKARQSSTNKEVKAQVELILKAVQDKGDAALKDYNQKFDGFKGDLICLEKQEMEAAKDRIGQPLLQAMRQAAENIWDFHCHQKQEGFMMCKENGSHMGQIVRPLDRVGVYVPGGTAAYPSSVLMNVIPAKVAGVSDIIMVTPPDQTGRISDNILAAAAIAGVDRIFLVGGAQGIAALAYGTETVPKVDKIVGPGNVYVATAKQLVYGLVDIDMIAGPSEILIIADKNANPAFVAADLLGQSEHDKLAGAVLLCDDRDFALAVEKEIEAQIEKLPRKAIAQEALDNYGFIVVFEDIEKAFTYANAFAPEHLEIILDDPMAYLGKVKHAGSVFLGPWTPESVGDYYAGANHVLPTSGTARFFSPLGVGAFLKRIAFTAYSQEALKAAAKNIICFAESEGLQAHAEAVKVRVGDEN